MTEEAFEPEVLAYYRAQHERQEEMKRRSSPRSRLTLQDFEEQGINVPKELWTALQRVEDPKDYFECFLKMLRFVLPTIANLDITQEIKTTGTHKIDLSSVPKEELVNMLRSAVDKETA